MADKTL